MPNQVHYRSRPLLNLLFQQQLLKLNCRPF